MSFSWADYHVRTSGVGIVRSPAIEACCFGVLLFSYASFLSSSSTPGCGTCLKVMFPSSPFRHAALVPSFKLMKLCCCCCSLDFSAGIHQSLYIIFPLLPTYSLFMYFFSFFYFFVSSVLLLLFLLVFVAFSFFFPSSSSLLLLSAGMISLFKLASVIEGATMKGKGGSSKFDQISRTACGRIFTPASVVVWCLFSFVFPILSSLMFFSLLVMK